jgi:hypothetical protein
MSSAVVCIAPTRPQANQMVVELKDARFSESVISVLFLDPETTRRFAGDHDTAAVPGLVGGATAGGLVGGVLGLSAGLLASLVVPGAGLVLAAGPVYLALSGIELGLAGTGGAMIGASVGGLISSRADVGGAPAGSIAGGLISLGIPAAAALEYEGKLHTGEILVAVQAEGEAESQRAGAILLEAGGHDLMSLSLPDTSEIDLGTATRA